MLWKFLYFFLMHAGRPALGDSLATFKLIPVTAPKEGRASQTSRRGRTLFSYGRWPTQCRYLPITVTVTEYLQISEKSREYFTLVVSICTASYNDDIFPLIGLTYTVDCRYNVVQYNMILYTSLHWLRQSMNQSEEPQNTLDSSPR